MPVYQYNLTSSVGNAFGTIEADDEDHATELLAKQYAPEEHPFINEKGKKLDIKIESLELKEIDS